MFLASVEAQHNGSHFVALWIILPDARGRCYLSGGESIWVVRTMSKSRDSYLTITGRFKSVRPRSF
jgi:hypothetical protein